MSEILRTAARRMAVVPDRCRLTRTTLRLYLRGDAPGGDDGRITWPQVPIGFHPRPAAAPTHRLGHAAEAINAAAPRCTCDAAGKPATARCARASGRKSISSGLSRPPRTTFTGVRCATCMTSAPPASSSPGSKVGPRISAVQPHHAEGRRPGRGRAQLAMISDPCIADCWCGRARRRPIIVTQRKSRAA